MPVIALIVIGAAAGFLATGLMRIEEKIPTTMLIGIVGAFVGEFLFRNILGGYSGFSGSVLGAVLTIWIRQAYLRR